MFDLSKVQIKNSDGSNGDGTPLPDGRYLVVCSDAVLGDTKDGLGERIKATFTVKTGAHRGAKIYEYYNTKNKNEVAVRIGMESLTKFFRNSSYSGDCKFDSAEYAAVEMCGVMSEVETITKPSNNPQYAARPQIKKYSKPAAGMAPAKTAEPDQDGDELFS